MPAFDITISAQWSVNQYTLSFDTGLGSDIDPIIQDFGTALSAPKDPTRVGYSFSGWEPAIPETVPAYDVLVRARWTLNQYTISFDTGGGTEIGPINQDFGSVIVPPDNPERTGYSFVAWSRQIPQTMPPNDLTITAQWRANIYSITFDTCGGDAISPIAQEYDTDVIAPRDPVRRGYTFTGWSVSIPERMPAHDTVITAGWNVCRYTITFDTAGGSEVEPITADYASEISPPASPVRTGYTFRAWSVSIPQVMPSGGLTVTAQWDINRYRITFDTAGGSDVMSQTYDFGAETAEVPIPSRYGFTFGGWTPEYPSEMCARDLHLTASWVPNRHTVTFSDRGSDTVLCLDFGSEITAPEPTRTGYSMVWDSDVVSRMPDCDLAYNALWTPNRHTVSFYEGGSLMSSVSAEYGSAIAYPQVRRVGYTPSWINYTETMPDSDVSVSLAWDVNRHSITFSLGTRDVAYTENYGTRITVPDPGTREGYYFAGWNRAVPDTMPDYDLAISACWEQTVRSGTGEDEGKFISLRSGKVAVSSADIRSFVTATVGVRSGWSVTLETGELVSGDVVSVALGDVGRNIPESKVSDLRGLKDVYELDIEDGDSRVNRTSSLIGVSIPYDVPEGCVPVVWVMVGGDMVEADGVSYSDGILSFSTYYAGYWAAGYVEEEIPSDPPLRVIAAVIVFTASAAAVSLGIVFLRIRRD